MAKFGKAKYGMTKYGALEPSHITVRNESDLKYDSIYAYINYTDLNRIESRTKELSDKLNALGITNEITTNVWEAQTEDNLETNLPTLEKTQNIIDNINLIYELISANFDDFVAENTCPDSMRFMNLKTMNNIESLLYVMAKFLNSKE